MPFSPPKAERREEEYKKKNALSLHALSNHIHHLLNPLKYFNTGTFKKKESSHQPPLVSLKP